LANAGTSRFLAEKKRSSPKKAHCGQPVTGCGDKNWGRDTENASQQNKMLRSSLCRKRTPHLLRTIAGLASLRESTQLSQLAEQKNGDFEARKGLPGTLTQ
jgi:hypothetical protein